MAKIVLSDYTGSKRKKRPGVHSKSETSKLTKDKVDETYTNHIRGTPRI